MESIIIHVTQNMQLYYLTEVVVVINMSYTMYIHHSSSRKALTIQDLYVEIMCREKKIIENLELNFSERGCISKIFVEKGARNCL